MIYVVENVHIEAFELHEIIHNGYLTSQSIASASHDAEAAVLSAANALNGTSTLLARLNGYLARPRISIGLGDLA